MQASDLSFIRNTTLTVSADGYGDYFNLSLSQQSGDRSNIYRRKTKEDGWTDRYEVRSLK